MENLERKIESLPRPQCLKCGKVMEGGSVGCYFYRDLWRIDVPYFLCRQDQVAELDRDVLFSDHIFQEKVIDKDTEFKKIDAWLHKIFGRNKKEI